MFLSYLAFFTFLFCVSLGILAIWIEPKAKLNRAFSMTSLTCAIWAFGSIFIYIENDRGMIWFWCRLALSGAIFLPFATFNFLYTFAELKDAMKRVFSVLRIFYFLFAAYLLYLQFTAPLYIVDFVRTPYGNAGIINPALPGYYLVIIDAALCLIFGIIFLIAGNKYNTSKRYKIQLKGLILFISIPIILIILSNFILPLVCNNPFPFIGIIFINISSAGIFYLITNFRMMRIGYSSLKPEDIASHISDMILLLDLKFEIVIANEAAEEILSVSRDTLKGSCFPGIAHEEETIRGIMNDFTTSDTDSLRLRLPYRKNDNETVLTETYISKVKDKLSDVIGILVISREMRGRKEFQNAYGITGREMEVLDLILACRSARSIGGKLRISRRTVESHLMHIYNKLGINNKPELFSFCAKFNLIP